MKLKSFIFYLVCFVIIVVGCFFGIQLYREVKAESYVNGSIDISNKFSQESFVYFASSLVFYHDEYDDSKVYNVDYDLLKVENFDGVNKNYEIFLNDYAIVNYEMQSGSIYFLVFMDFRGISGDVVCNGELSVSIKFLSGKTVLTITTVGIENAMFFEQYFNDNGIKLVVNEIL